MKRIVKLGVLHACKLLGLFSLARRVTGRGVRILCYHGLAFANEYTLKPKLFIRPATFRHRMELLRKHGFPLLSLREAIAGLGTGELPDCATVITFDDGWHSVHRYALPILRELKIPATVYVTTYYVQKAIPDTHALLEYAIGNAVASQLYLSDFPSEVCGPWNLRDREGRARALSALIEYIDTCAPQARPPLARKIVDRLGIDWAELEKTKMFYLMDAAEIRALDAAGIDVQLHTHRHRLPIDDRSIVEREIQDNRRDLEQLVTAPLDHLAYPKGEYDPCQFGWLDGVGIKSATTCHPGINYADTQRLELYRFLDGENVSDIEFEAELTGMATILRNLTRLGPARAKPSQALPLLPARDAVR